MRVSEVMVILGIPPRPFVGRPSPTACLSSSIPRHPPVLGTTEQDMMNCQITYRDNYWYKSGQGINIHWE